MYPEQGVRFGTHVRKRGVWFGTRVLKEGAHPGEGGLVRDMCPEKGVRSGTRVLKGGTVQDAGPAKWGHVLKNSPVQDMCPEKGGHVQDMCPEGGCQGPVQDMCPERGAIQFKTNGMNQCFVLHGLKDTFTLEHMFLRTGRSNPGQNN